MPALLFAAQYIQLRRYNYEWRSIETIARAAIAVGADGLFIETHADPANAKSDGANMLHLDKIESLLERLVRLRQVINEFDQ